MIKKIGLKTVLVVGLLSTAFVSSADALIDAKIKHAVERKVGLAVEKISPSPIKGLSEVLTERGLFYVSNDGSFFVQGDVYNIDKGMKNETETTLIEVRKKGLKEFAGQMITYKAKNEKYQVNVFTDTSCGYCRKMHSQIDEYNALGITVNYLAFPRNGVNSRAYLDLVSVWCADDTQSALTEAKMNNNIAMRQCKNSVKEQYQFGAKVGVNGTPAVVLNDGTLIPGYRKPADLLKMLQG